MVTLLKREINSINRQYYIEKVNAPLFKAITILGNRYPTPTMENVGHPNTRRVLEILSEYNRYDTNIRRRTIINTAIRIVVSKIEHSPNWRDVFCWWVDRLRRGEWKPRSLGHPHNDWNEPQPYGGS